MLPLAVVTDDQIIDAEEIWAVRSDGLRVALYRKSSEPVCRTILTDSTKSPLEILVRAMDNLDALRQRVARLKTAS